jgi:hypothetical protein
MAQGRPIFVLGIDRSGTSLLSELLFHWGAQAGRPEHLPVADEGNPQGYWEYAPMQEFLAELLDGTSLWDPGLDQVLLQRAMDPELRRRARMLGDEMRGAGGGSWFWKDSKLIFSLPFLRQVFPEAIYLITLRNPYDSALSYEKLSLPSPLRGKVRLVGYTLLRWQHMMVAICEGLKDYPSKLLVSYETLVSSPREQCTRLCQFLAAEGAADDGGGLERMTRAINPGLWRNNSKASFLDVPAASTVQKDLFSYLSARLDGDLADFDSARYPFPEVSREYCANMSILLWLLGNL